MKSFFFFFIFLMLGLLLNAQNGDTLFYSNQYDNLEIAVEKIIIIKPNRYYYIKQISNYYYYDKGFYIEKDSTYCLNTDEPDIIGIDFVNDCSDSVFSKTKKIIVKNRKGEGVFSCLLINTTDTICSDFDSDTILYDEPIICIQLLYKEESLSEGVSVPWNATCIQIRVNTDSKDVYSRADMYNRVFWKNKRLKIIGDTCLMDEWNTYFYKVSNGKIDITEMLSRCN